jgi:glycine/D-amino acid oxidase-like deaminating enzyme
MEQRKVDYLLVGQGIAGTMLSWFLQQAGKTVMLIDSGKSNSASRVAAGIINPVSGRRFEPAWMYDTIYPFAKTTYAQVAALLGTPIFKERDIWMVFPSAQMQQAFKAKTAGAHPSPYTEDPPIDRFAGQLQQPHGAAVVKGATVQLRALLPAYRSYLLATGSLLEQQLDPRFLEITETGVIYDGLAADKVIFCDGVATTANPWFEKLTFLPNKGEVLLVKIPGLVTDNIIKKGITLVPQEEPEVFWAGSSFVWDYTDDHPTVQQRLKLEDSLDQLLNMPYQVLDQMSAVRPSGNDRRPMIGLHPVQRAIGIFNGLGTKGCSLAPFMAHHFVQHLVHQTPLLPEIDIQRYFK